MEVKKTGKTLLTALVTAVILCFAQIGAAQIPPMPHYLIQGSGQQFTATLNNAVIGQPNQPLQSVIDAVRTDAAGNDCDIQLGNGITPLDIGNNTITFDGSGWMSWGAIRLTGKVTSQTLDYGVIRVIDASVNSMADITNTGEPVPGSGYVCGILNTTGSVVISSGTVSSMYGAAIINESTGLIAVSGGTVSSVHGMAILNQSEGTVNINSGKVLARDGYAVNNAAAGTVVLTGTGVVFAYGTGVRDVIYGDYTTSGYDLNSSLIIAWNQAAGNTNYIRSSSTDLFDLAATYIIQEPYHPKIAVWDVREELLPGDNIKYHGITYNHLQNTGFIDIEGVTIAEPVYRLVTFDSQEGTPVSSQLALDGGKATKPTDPTRTDYTFAGWFITVSADDIECTAFGFICRPGFREWNFQDDIVTKNITLYAMWDESGTSIITSPPVNVNSLSPVISVRGRTLNVLIPSSPQSSQTANLQIRMIDMRGRTVSNFNMSSRSDNSFQLTKIPAGRYIVEVRNAGKRVNSTPVMIR